MTASERAGFGRPNFDASIERWRRKWTSVAIRQWAAAEARDENGGRVWRPRGDPRDVRVHDFLDKTLGKAIPSGVHDLLNNQGWVSVGITHDAAELAVNSIRQWWARMGRQRFPRTHTLLITSPRR